MPKRATNKQKAVRNKFSKAAKEYRTYKKSNPNGSKKIATFIKEAFKK